MSNADRARHQPRAADRSRRAVLRGRAARAVRSRGRVVLRARPGSRRRLRARRRRRGGRRRHLPEGGRPAARDRAGRGALRAAEADARSPNASTPRSAAVRGTRPPASRRCARRSTGATTCSARPRRACFAHFAAFAGGATVEAAVFVTGADLDTLDRLVAKSLLVRHQQANSAHPARDARDDPGVRRRALRRRRRPRGRPRAPPSLVPRRRRAPRNRPSTHGPRRRRAPRASRRGDSEPQCRPELGGGTTRRRPRDRDGRRGGALLVDAGSLRRRGHLDRTGREPAGDRTPSGAAVPRSPPQGAVSLAVGTRRRAAVGHRRARDRGQGVGRPGDPLAGAGGPALLRARRRAQPRGGRTRRRGARVGDGVGRRVDDRGSGQGQGVRGLHAPGAAGARRRRPLRCSPAPATSTRSRTCSARRRIKRSASAANTMPSGSSTARRRSRGSSTAPTCR